ncbi:MAG: hypothetical protein QNJ57_07085 [Flavobacteriaceae bacterium]|nr:hypothetical protein [Flavobacteriaceae bacterium]
MQEYIANYDFLMYQYSQLLAKVIKSLSKPVEESVFIDYGGGCGILSYLAKAIGFKKVIYNDIYELSVNDSKLIAQQLSITIDNFIFGDVDQLILFLEKQDIKPDMICSLNVLEHIYDVKGWFNSIIKIQNSFSLLFMTSANSKNPFIAKRLMKLHKKVEFEGVQRKEGWKEIDLSSSFLEERKKIITAKSGALKPDEIKHLAHRTRGLRKNDILKLVDEYTKGKEIKYKINHPTNTCDPYTGNWAEHLIDLNQLKSYLEGLKLKVTFTNSYYGYSKNKFLNAPKFILNIFMKIFGKHNLVFSPTYTLEAKKVV